MAEHDTKRMVAILRETMVALIRRDGPDLSTRQLGILLTCYLEDGPHTIPGLARDLNVSKPAVTRALNRVGDLQLACRGLDPANRRSVLVQRTIQGRAFLKDMQRAIDAAVKAPDLVDPDAVS